MLLAANHLHAVHSAPTPALHRLIGRAGVRQHLRAGEHLFDEGQEVDDVYVIQSGALHIGVSSARGRMLTVDVLQAGEVLAEVALSGGNRTVTVTALKTSVLQHMWRPYIMAAMRANPELALEFINLLCDRLRSVNGRLEERAFLPLRARLAKRLLYLCDKVGDADGAVAASQAELANHIGATREAVARTLGEWRSCGWVALSRQSVRILDHHALEAAAS